MDPDRPRSDGSSARGPVARSVSGTRRRDRAREHQRHEEAKPASVRRRGSCPPRPHRRRRRRGARAHESERDSGTLEPDRRDAWRDIGALGRAERGTDSGADARSDTAADRGPGHTTSSPGRTLVHAQERDGRDLYRSGHGDA